MSRANPGSAGSPKNSGGPNSGAEPFDPYYTWLGIPPDEQPPNFYRLLGLRKYENNREVISHAADARMAHLKTFQTSKRAQICQKLLTEISGATKTLLNDEKRAAYDQQLQATEVAIPVAVPLYPQAQPPQAQPYAPQGYATPAAYAPYSPTGQPYAGATPGYPQQQYAPVPQAPSAGPEISTAYTGRRRGKGSNSHTGLMVGASIAVVLTIVGIVVAFNLQPEVFNSAVNDVTKGSTETPDNSSNNTTSPDHSKTSEKTTPETVPPQKHPPEEKTNPGKTTPEKAPAEKAPPEKTPPKKGSEKKAPDKGKKAPKRDLQLTYGEETKLIEKLVGEPRVLAGSWTRSGNLLVSAGGPRDVVTLDDAYPPNYSLRARIRRKDFDGELWFVIPIANMTTVLAIDSFEGQFTGFDTIQGETLDQQQANSRFTGRVFENTDFHDIEILVFKDQISFKVGNKGVFNSVVEAGSVGVSPARQLPLPVPKSVTIGSSNGAFEVGSLSLTSLIDPRDKTPGANLAARPSFSELSGQEKVKPSLPAGEQAEETAKTAETALKARLKPLKSSWEKQTELWKVAGKGIRSESDTEFVGLVTAASKAAAEAEDPVTALTMIDVLESRYSFDSTAKRIEILTAVGKKDPPVDVRRGMLLIMWDECRKASEGSALDHVEALSKMAAATGAKVRDPNAKKKSEEIKKELEKARKQYGELFAARDILKDKPDDGDANTKVGLYELLMFGEMEEGLKHLMKSGDPKIAEAAKIESGTRGDFDIDRSLAIANAWFEAAPGIDPKFKPLAAYKTAIFYDRLIESEMLADPQVVTMAGQRRDAMKKLAGSVKPEKMARDLSKILIEMTLSARLETMFGGVLAQDKSTGLLITVPSKYTSLDKLRESGGKKAGRLVLEGLADCKQLSTWSASVQLPGLDRRDCELTIDGEKLDLQPAGANMARKTGIAVKPGLHSIRLEFNYDDQARFMEVKLEDVSGVAPGRPGTAVPIFHNAYDEAMIMAAGQRVLAIGN